MNLAIAILLGISFIINIISKKGNANLAVAAALVLVLWNMCFPLAIITIVVASIGALIWAINQSKH